MKILIAILFGLVSTSTTHKKSVQPVDNPSIDTVEITHSFFGLKSKKVALRRNKTEVYVSRIRGRCTVVGFVDASTVLVKLPDSHNTVMPFHKNRITLAPVRK